MSRRKQWKWSQFFYVVCQQEGRLHYHGGNILQGPKHYQNKIILKRI